MLRSRRWQRRLAWAVGGWLLLWALAYAAVPAILKWQLLKIAFEKLGRQVTLGQVDFKPWSLELTLNDLVIAKSKLPEPGSPATAPGNAQPLAPLPPQLKIRRIYIDAELESLLRLAPVADAIRVEEPVASLTHLGNGHYDIDDILDRLKSGGAEPAGKAPRFSLYNLMLSGGQLDFIDQAVHKTHTLRELNLAVPFLSNLKSQREIKTTPRLAFTLNGSRFDSAAVGTPFAQTRQADASMTLRADASFKGFVSYRQSAAGAQAVVRGDAALEEFKANPLAPGEELRAWKALNLRGLNVALDPARATRVDVKQNLLKSATPAGAANPAAATAPPADATKIIAYTARRQRAVALKDSQTEALTAPVVSFGPMSLINGKVLFSDRFVKPNYSANLRELTGTLSAFSSVAPAAAAISISPAEYPALLKEVYQRADMAKPRNLIGLAKSLPVPDMEKLLLASITVNDDAMRELAVQRGVAVKDYLAASGLSPDRLFLGAVKAVPPEAKWTPRAELNLATP